MADAQATIRRHNGKRRDDPVEHFLLPHLTATADLFDEDGEPAGTATLEADLVPDGDPIAVNDRFRDGNRMFRYRGTTQPYAVEGTLSLPGDIEFDLSECTANRAELSAFETNPTMRSSGIQAFYDIETEDGMLFLYSLADRAGTYPRARLPREGVGGAVERGRNAAARDRRSRYHR